MPTWPVTLPQKLRQTGFQEGPPNTLLRSQMDSGPAKVRRRFTAGVVEISGEMVLSQAQWLIFKAFYNADLVSGALSFDFPDPDDGQAVISVRIKNYKRTAAGGIFSRLNLELEKLP